MIEVKRKLWIAALASCSWQFALGEGKTQSFKPGDYVEVMDGTSWQACIVSGKYRPTSGDYPVSCGTKELFASVATQNRPLVAT